MSAEEFRQSLLDKGLLIAGGAAGVYHRSFAFERIIRGVESYASAAGQDVPRRQLYLSPLMDRSVLVGSGYLTSFPNLVGVLSSFMRPERDLLALVQRVEAGEEWADMLSPNELALCGAACHNLYPMLTGSVVPFTGILYEVQSMCFRHEPSHDPARMQSFSMREFVYVGTEAGAFDHRELWLRRGSALLSDLGLAVEVVPANDPFFGRAGKLIGDAQRKNEAKFEIVAEITSSTPGAISSGNYHGDHFGRAFDFALPDGTSAYTACFGFGLERISLALLFRHGLDVTDWPRVVRDKLGLVDATC